MKVAVVGTGISGLVCAHLLSREHEVHDFEAADYLGGHTHTVGLQTPSGKYAIDTGFIVFNNWTYPNFVKLLDRIGVPSQESAMSFSVKTEESGLEYRLLPQYQENLALEKKWVWNGTHYAKTAEAWLENQDRNRAMLIEVFAKVYGAAEAGRWFQRWRVFFMSCSELFGYQAGSEWGVSHY